jgi:hypothetical protein
MNAKMDTVRGLGVWLAPPLLASVLCTVAWQVVWGNSTYPSSLLAAGVMSLPFTLGGSTLLTLVFARMSAPSSVVRYLVLMVTGVVVGGSVMLLLSGPSKFAVAGAAYGGATASLWVLFHRLIYGRG